MDRTRLQQLLEELHQELTGATTVDPESRRMLEQALREIRLVTEHAPEEMPEGATAQLREAALRLEAGHPRLAGVLGQLTDTLAKLGI
ncbi:MAG: DUF4404 family protein [Gammaproteobacteria bacterium]|nr:MAG: DUF4404 family protein [Gammaproteobacteria bacterium]